MHWPGIELAIVELQRQLNFIFATSTKISLPSIVKGAITSKTRKLCYHKDDRAMRPTYGCPEHFRDSLGLPDYAHGIIPNIFMGFFSDQPYECSYKI